MRVLHVAETIKGGVATVLNELLDFQTIQKDIEVFCLIPEQQKNDLKYNKSIKISTFKRNKRSIKSLISLSLMFKRLLSLHCFDVVHIHSTFAGVICRVILFITRYKGRVVYCPHAFSFLISGSRVKKYIYSIIERLLQVITGKIICVSNYEYEQAILNGMKENNLVVIHNGISDCKAEFKIKKNKKGKTLLFVGRFDYQKGFDVLIKAIKEIPLSLGYKFIIVGDYVNDNSDRTMEIPENVTFTGWLNKEQIVEKYIECDVLVMPSRWEGFAMVPIESFKYGMPVIASKNTSFPEIVKDGWNGFLVDTGDHNSLAHKIISLDKIDIERLSVNARTTFVDNFTADKMNNKVISIYGVN